MLLKRISKEIFKWPEMLETATYARNAEPGSFMRKAALVRRAIRIRIQRSAAVSK
jgi:hypothetical protein